MEIRSGVAQSGISTVTDGMTTVTSATELTFVGATVTNSGGGNATVTVTGGGSGTVTSVVSGNGMNFTTITTAGSVTMGTPSTLTVATSNALTTTSHTHAITSSSAPGAAASLLATDSSGIIGSTGTRIVKGWFTDLQVTNAIAGSITGNSATVTTNANLTGVITSVGNATSIASQTGTGTKFVVDTSPTLVTPLLGTPTSGVLTNCTGLPAASVVAGTLGTGSYTIDTQLTVKQIVNASNAITASGNAATVPITSRISTVTNNSAATLTITITTTSAVDGQMVMVRVLDFSGVAQTIAWVNTENSTVTAPVLSNGSTTLPLTVGFQYNNATSKWRCIASC